jgi:hypothetical protein
MPLISVQLGAQAANGNAEDLSCAGSIVSAECKSAQYVIAFGLSQGQNAEQGCCSFSVPPFPGLDST